MTVSSTVTFCATPRRRSRVRSTNLLRRLEKHKPKEGASQKATAAAAAPSEHSFYALRLLIEIPYISHTDNTSCCLAFIQAQPPPSLSYEPRICSNWCFFIAICYQTSTLPTIFLFRQDATNNHYHERSIANTTIRQNITATTAAAAGAFDWYSRIFLGVNSMKKQQHYDTYIVSCHSNC